VLDVDPKNGGDESLLKLINTHDRLPNTWQVLTGGGGMHYYFKSPDFPVRNSAGLLGPGLDIRADGGFVVAPPSVHASGELYKWADGSSPFDGCPLAELPSWLLSLLSKPRGDIRFAQKNTLIIPEGERNARLTSYAGKLRNAGLQLAELESALFAYNTKHCVPPLPESEVRGIAHSISKYPSTHKPDDDDLASAWLESHPDTAYGLGDFRRYKDGVWETIPQDIVEGEILNIMQTAKLSGLRVSSPRLRSVLDLARVRCRIPDNRWDSDPDILVLNNGTLYIPTRTLREHRLEDYQTSRISIDYDLDAQAITWKRYLETSCHDTAGFLQEFAGYCLTIDTSYELAIWLYGPAGSGKSTFLTGLQTMLGHKAGLLGLADLEKNRFATANIPGKTLLISSEQPATMVTTTHILNALISGEPLTIEGKYKNPFVITPHAKLVWAMNELPRIHEAGNGLFRRVKVVPFPQLPESERDPKLKAEIKNEGAGILNWALDGLARLRKRSKFEIPQCVLDATADFARKDDIPRLFVDECCKTGKPEDRVQASELYEAYTEWCLSNGHRPKASNHVAEDWRRFGFSRTAINGRRYWTGIRLMAMEKNVEAVEVVDPYQTHPPIQNTEKVNNGSTPSTDSTSI
jgi:putative DNA primase/helicase